MNFFSTVPKFLNILVLISIVVLIVKALILNEVKEVFVNAYEIGLIVEAVLASILASYIFYMVVVHLKEYQDRKHIYPLLLKWADSIVGDCRSQLNEFGKASGIALDFDNVKPVDLNSAFQNINPMSPAPLLLAFPNTSANWIQYMQYHQNRTKNDIAKLASQMLFVESELVSKALEIDDCTYFKQLDAISNLQLRNTNISFVAKLFHDYCILCKEFKVLIDTSKKYG